jgi:hypothetical protein
MIKNSLGKKPSIILPTDLSDADATKWGLKVYVGDKSGGANDIAYNNGIKATISKHADIPGTLDTVYVANFIPYQMQDGTWRIHINFNVALSATARSDCGLRFNGIVFGSTANGAGYYWTAPVRAYSGGADNYIYSQVNAAFGTPAQTEYVVSGDFPLASKPSWAY